MSKSTQNELLSAIRRRDTLLIIFVIISLVLGYISFKTTVDSNNSFESPLKDLIIDIIPEFIATLIAVLSVYFGLRSVQDINEEIKQDSFNNEIKSEFGKINLELYRITTRLDSIQGEKGESSLVEYSENFQAPLSSNWYFNGDWSVESDNNGSNFLVVTNSDAGGIISHCLNWTNYIFEFETKIINSNSSWIIRAKDTLNYVMFQCSSFEIKPHFRNGVTWCTKESIRLPFVLSLNTWIRVQIVVQGTRVIINLDERENQLREVLNLDLLRSPITVDDCFGIDLESPSKLLLMSSFTQGSVGFREHGHETAHFRTIRITKL